MPSIAAIPICDTYRAVTVLQTLYPALSTYYTLQEYEVYLSRDPAALSALSQACAGRYQTGAYHLLLLGARRLLFGWVRRIDDPDLLFVWLLEAVRRGMPDPYAYCFGALRNYLASLRAATYRDQDWIDTELLAAGSIRGFEEVGTPSFDIDPFLRDQIWGALSRLTPRQQSALLGAIQGETDAEIAARLGCSSDAARRALSRARVQLRRFLKI